MYIQTHAHIDRHT